MSALPLLNLDIIREISSHLPLPACASLMCTSWFFYHEAAKAALQHPVYLFDIWEVELFARFVCAENGTRLRYVREVHIGSEEHDMSEWALQWLSEHIPRMSSLTTIVLTGEDCLDPTPELYAAIASLTSLHHLKIEGAGRMFVSLINSLRSKLQSANVMWLPPHRDGLDHEALMQESMHPVQLLSKSCDTLENLSCQNWYTAHNLPLLPTVYPKMREFSFNDDNYPLILPYVRAFPNLTRLCLGDINYGELVRVDRTGTLMTRLQEHRALNVKSQLYGVAWTKLDQLVGSMIDLYILAPTCLIDRLELSGYLLRSQHLRSHDMLLETLPFARPKQLRIFRGRDTALLLHPTNNLAVILQTPAGSRLENLVLDIQLDKIDGEADIAAALISFSETLTHVCSLRRLRLRVWGDFLSVHTEMITRAERSLKSFDAVAYARTLESSIPSLEDIAVGINDIREMNSIVATPAGIVPEDGVERYHGKRWEL